MRRHSGVSPVYRLPAHCDPKVVEELYDMYGDICYAVARKILGDPLALDQRRQAPHVVRDAFLQVWSERAGALAFDPRRVGARLMRITYQASKSIVAARQSASATPGLELRDEVPELRARLKDANRAFPDARDELADHLDQLAAQLDASAAARDLAALDRDVYASERDRSARLRNDGSDAQASIDRIWAGADRDLAAGDRADAREDRENAAADREQAAEVRHTAAAGRHAAEQLVTVESLFDALRDRQAIWQAQGVLMASQDVNAPDTFELSPVLGERGGLGHDETPSS